MQSLNPRQLAMFAEITAGLGVDFDADSRVHVEQSPGYIDSPIETHDLATAMLAAVARAIATVGAARGLGSQDVTIDRRHAGLVLNSVAYHFQSGWQLDIAPVHTPVNAFYETRDGRWIFYNGAYAHLREGILQFLGCPGEREAIAAATRRYDAQALEDELAARGLCASIARSRQQWLDHPQGRALCGRPVVELIKLSDGPPQPLPECLFRPLERVRVLEIGRVLAGPTIGRTLAEQGADVIHCRHPYLDHIVPFEIETGWAKKSAYLDYKIPRDRQLLLELLDSADVLVEGLRLGALDRVGLSPEALAARNPGLIYVQENGYGYGGPWDHRRGWEQLAQAATGLAERHSAGGPLRLIPAYLGDYGTGLLGALGVTAALLRRATEGGSWLVRVALAKTAMLATHYANNTAPQQPLAQHDLERYLVDQESPLGLLTRVGPPMQFQRTPSLAARSAAYPGADTLHLAWDDAPSASPPTPPHRPTEIFRHGQVHWEGNQVL
ncbi:MAG: CoA transferase [Pirellulaceae bacterium]